MLSPLQRQIAIIIVAGLPEAEDFALAGGAALIVHGAIDRTTRDLDFFGLEPQAVDRLAPVAERALRAEGLTVERILHNPGFVRLLVSADDDRTEIDLGSDARLFPVDVGPGFPLLTTEELAVDKVRGVFGRAEARDFMDLMAVEDRYWLERLLEVAAEKDRGFEPLMFSDMTERFDRLRRDEFPVDDEQYGQLARIVRIWRTQARELGRTLDRGRHRGDDLGIGL